MTEPKQQTVQVELTVQQLNMILVALSKQPLEAVLDTFNTIQQQAAAQLGAPGRPAE